MNMFKEIKKISINLNPQKEDASGRVFENVFSCTPLVGLATILVWIFILSLQAVILKKVYTHSRYKHKWVEWAPKANTLKQLKDEIAKLESTDNKIRELTTPKYEIAAILKDLFSSLPKNVWFETLDFTEDFINLKGYVVKWHEDYLFSLDTFIGTIKGKKYFSSKFNKVNIKDSQKANFNGIEVLQFVIECKK